MRDGIIDEVIAEHRKRCFAMEQRKRINLALGSFLRTQLGWRRDLPEADRKRVAAEASAIADDPSHPDFGTIVGASHATREPWEAVEAAAKRRMESLAKELPVWASFGAEIRGFGALSLAIIVGEAGDIANYSTHSKLWKRMGVAVIDGVRQGNPGKTATAEDWVVHGYNPMRRSRLFTIGDSLIKGNRDGVYRVCYLARKSYEVERDPEIKPIAAHRRAQRYMEKRLLRDLWKAWRRADVHVPERANPVVPAAQLDAAA